MTPTEAREIYNAGEKAVTLVLCNLSNIVKSQQKNLELQQREN